MNELIRDVLQQIATHSMAESRGLALLQELRGGGDAGGARALSLYAPAWVSADEAAGAQGAPPSLGVLLVLDDAEPRVAALRAVLGSGTRVIQVRTGPGYARLSGECFQVSPREGADYARLLEALGGEGPRVRHVVQAWGWEGAIPAEDLTGEALGHEVSRALDLGVCADFELCKALMHARAEGVELLHVYAAGPGPSPFAELVAGFARSVALENPGYRLRVAGFDTVLQGEALARAIMRELTREAGRAIESRWEHGGRRVRKLAPLAGAEGDTREGVRLREGGTYLLTGGLGGLGYLFAEHLAETHRARLVLLGRSPRTAEVERKLLALERKGAEVLYVPCDVTVATQVEEAVVAARRRFGALQGVLHCAGVLRDAFLLLKSRADFEAVLAPKVLGTLMLDRACRDEALDFFVVFASVAGLLGNVGQGDYASGNAFQDAFCAWRRQQQQQGRRHGGTLSVDWPLWKDGGMTVDAEVQRRMAEAWGLEPLSTGLGLLAFMRAARSGASQVMVAWGDAAQLASALERLWERESGGPRAEAVAAPARGGGDEALLRERTEDYLKELVARRIKLPVERMRSERPFQDYGIDSVVVLSLTEALEGVFGTLPKTLFFEYGSVAELAQYFLTHHGAKLRERFPAPAPAASTPEAAAAPVGHHFAPARRQPVAPARARDEEHGTEELAVVGLSGRFPMARDVEEFWANLVAGRDCVTEVPAARWEHARLFDPDKSKVGLTYGKWGGFLQDFDCFDPLFFNISPREAEFMDPQERLFLEVAWEVLEDAGYTRRALAARSAAGGDVGVFVGVMYGQYQLHGAEQAAHGRPMALDSSYASIANRVSYVFDFQGPSLAVDTMCSSSLTALHLACESIRRGECRAAIAGGVNVMSHPNKYLLLSQGKFLSTDGRCRSFGAGGDGYVPGEGVGAVFIKPLADALEDGDHVYCVIKGSAINHGGKANHYTVPSPNAQARVISRTLARAGVSSRSISYLEAHGTGTSLGDPVEIRGLTKAFGDGVGERQFCAIGSAKSNIGHLESAAGIAGLTKIILQLQHRQLVPSLHAEQLNPHIDFAGSPFYVQRELTGWKRPVLMEGGEARELPRRAGLSSFGAGGTNVHLVVEEAAEPGAASPPTAGVWLVPLSAKTEAALARRREALARWLEGREEPVLPDLGYTLCVGREHFSRRCAFVVHSLAELREALEEVRQGRHPSSYLAPVGGEPALAEGRALEELLKGLRREARELAGRDVRAHEEKLRALAGLYCQGRDVEWEALYDGGFRRLSLPTYPFARERYWVPGAPTAPRDGHAEAPVPAAAREAPRSVHAFVPVWNPVPLTTAPGALTGQVLLLDREGSLAERLRQVGADVVLVRPGSEFRRVGAREFILSPASEADYTSLLAALEQEGFSATRIVHQWSRFPFGSEDGGGLEAQLDEGVRSMFLLARALLPRRRGEQLQLLFSSARAAGETQPACASVSGFARSLMLEHPRVECRVLDVVAPSGEEAARCVLQELRAGGGAHVEVRYRGGARLVKELRPVALEGGAEVPLREGGVYVISGGAGGLGLLFAEHLARTRRAKLVLLGRSALAPEKMERLRALERLGAEVLYVPCDISRAADVERAISEAKRRFGVIHGVLHGAGVLRDALLVGKEAAAFSAVLAPKVAGTLNLDAATRGEPLDFFVLFSSIAGTTGNLGQTDYAAGNAFQDAWALHREELRRAGARGGRTLSIGWPLWREGGMQVGGAEEAGSAEWLRRTHGMVPMGTANGLAAFELALGGEAPHLIVVEGERERLSALLERSLRVPPMVEPAAGPASPPRATATRELMAAIQGGLVRMVSELLKVPAERVEADASFGDFGFDSVTLKEFTERLNTLYGLRLMPSIFFEHNSASALGRHLVEAHGEALRQRGREEPAAAPVAASGPTQGEPGWVEPRPERAGPVASPGVEPIAIVGVGGIFPESPELDTFWEHLVAERDLIREVPAERWDWRRYAGEPEKEGGRSSSHWGGFVPDVDKFDAAFFRSSPREAQLMDPQHRLFLETAWRTLENAGHAPSSLAGQSIGVFVGVQFNDYQGVVKDSGESHGFAATGNSHAMLANRLSFLLDLHGPSESVDTACSSSLVALARAVNALQAGDCTAAIVGGVSLMLSPDTFVVTSQMGVLSPDGRCKTFDKTANGYVKGEGVGVVYLKPLSQAQRDGDFIHAVIRAAAVNHGGAAHSLTAPNPKAQSALLVNAWRKARVDPATVTYIEAHGTGTELGDPVEVEGLKHAFRELLGGDLPEGREPFCGLGSVKSNIGHLEPAAGIAGLLKVVLALRHGKLPASLHCRELNPYIQLEGSPFYIVRRTQEWSRLKEEGGHEVPRRAGVSSFGFGGANAHVVLEEAPRAEVARGGSKPCHLVTLSAKSEEALRLQVEGLGTWLERGVPGVALEDVSYTLNTGRDHHPWRMAFAVSSLSELRDTLRQVREGKAPANHVAGKGEKEARGPLFEEMLAVLHDAIRPPPRLDAVAYRRKLLALADLYTRGYALDWGLLHEGEAHRRIPLPGTAFLRKRYWVDAPRAGALQSLPAPAAAPRVEAPAPGPDFFFVPTWTPSPLPAARRSVDPGATGRSILLVNGSAHPSLVEVLKARHAGEQILELDSSDVVAIDSRVVQAVRLDCVYFLGGVQAAAFEPSDLPALARSQERGVVSLFRLVKSLHRYRYGGQPLTLKVLVNDVHPLAEDAPVHPGGAALVGFVQSLAKEFPAWSVSCLDASGDDLGRMGGAGLEEVVGALVDEPGHPKGEPVLLRRGVRFTRTVRRLRLPAARATRFKQGGVYLILGGAGGIGLALSEYLANRVQARLVLVGRRAPSAELQAAIARIEAAGGRALYVQADGTDLASMREAVARAKAEFGRIDGAVHSAIVLRDRMLANMDEETFRSALAPKVEGSVVLQQALAGEPLDFLLFLSSAQSILGDAGQSNYAAGCTFKDAFAHHLGRMRGCTVRTLNWGYWGRVGIVATDAYGKRLSALGVLSIEVSEGMEAIERVLAAPVSQVMPLKVVPQVLEMLGIDTREPVSVLPEDYASPGERVVRLASAQLAPPRDMEQKSAAFSQLERFGHLLVLRAFQELGVLRGPGEEYVPEALRERLGVVPDFHRLFGGLLDILVRAGFLAPRGGSLASTAALAGPELQRSLRELAGRKAELARTYPSMAAHLELLWTCVSAYPGVLRGQVDPIGVMFPNGSPALVEGVYKGNEIVDRCNEAVSRAVVAFVEERMRAGQGGRVRIVEVGAGTGGTSERLLRDLAPHGVHLEYHYTDISPSFLKFGEGKYGARYSFARFRMLDIEKAPEPQGFEGGGYDLVVATNVLHATRDMVATLRHVKRLLRPNGALVVNEVMVAQDFATLTFGLTKGWWLYDDAALRLWGGPLLGLRTWAALLEGEGFGRVSTVPADEARTNPLGQYVLYAESNGQPRGHAQAVASAQAAAPVPEVKPAAPEAVAPPRGGARDADAVRRYVEERIVEAVTRALRVDPRDFALDKPYVDFGIDSMMAVEVIGRINGALKINLRSTDLFSYATIGELGEHILTAFGEGIELPAAAAEAAAPEAAAPEVAAPPPLAPPAIPVSPVAAEPVPAGSIAVIGMSARYAGARNVEQFWENLKTGRNSIREMPEERRMGGDTAPRWGGFISDVDAFDPGFFNISGREAELMDPQQRLFLQEAWAALEDAGYSDRHLEKSRCGVFVGCFPGDYKYRLKEAGLKPEAYLLSGNSESILASRISYFLNLRGPSVAIDTACSSSLVALHLACESIRAGSCEMALAGGVTLLTTPEFHVLAGTAGMLSEDGQCWTFDSRANGFVPGEGVGAVVLKSLDAALRDGDHIHGVIRASGLNQDGKTNGITAPSAASQTSLEVEVYRRAGIDPADLGYVEAHGTGTRLGDPIEVSALADAFRRFTDRKRFCALGAVKTNIGHGLPASGLAGLIKVLQCLQHRQLVPSLNFQRSNEHIDFESSPFYVNTELKDWTVPEGKRRLAAVSAFGFSGTNAHVLVEEAPRPVGSHLPGRAWNLVTLSAKTDEALRRRMEALRDWLVARGGDVRLEDVSLTLNVGRSHFPRRCAFVAGRVEELSAALGTVLEGAAPVGYVASRPGASRPEAGTLPSLEGGEPAELRRRLLEVAERYCAGEDIAWARLHAGGPGRRLPMPTYPFARERYWVPGAPRVAAPGVKAEPTVAPSSIPTLIEAVQPHLRGASALLAYVDAFGELECFGQLILLEAFQRMGVLREVGERYRRDELRQRLGVVEQYERLFDCLLDLLVRAGFLTLERGGQELVVADSVASGTVTGRLSRLEAERESLMVRCPEVAPHLRLLWACVSAYPEVLTGRNTPMAVMFPSGSTHLVEGIYKGNAVVDHYNQLVARLVEAYVRERVKADPSARVRILEVGAGTGGTSGFVLAALQPLAAHVEYRYTDISPRFARHGEETYGPAAPYARFQVLDIEQPPETQGFELGCEDLIFATNVLHATRDMQRTLRHVRGLLRGGGLLVVNEIMKRQDYATLTFGLTKGWWLYDDEPRRIPGSPLLDVASWSALLREGGWREVHPVEAPGSEGAVSRVLVAVNAAAGALAAPRPVEVVPVRPGVEARAEGGPPAGEQLRAAAAAFIRKTFCEVLKLDRSRLDDHTSFDAYGVDSLVVMELMKPLTEALGELPPTLLFEQRTVGTLVEHLVQERPVAVARLGVPTLPAAPATPAREEAPAAAARPARSKANEASERTTELLARELAWLPEGKKLESGRVPTRSGTHVEVLACGAGSPLVLLPPLNTLAVVWLAQLVELSRRYRVFVVHPAGHGRSDFTPAFCDFFSGADILLEALEGAGAGRGPLDVVGWSLGGCQAQLLALKHPERIRTLTLVSTAAAFSGGYEAKALAIRQELESNLSRIPRALQSSGRLLEVITATNDGEVMMAYYQCLRAFDVRHRLREISAPTLVVSGARDRILSPDAGRELHQGLASSGYVEFKSAGHFVPLVNPRKFNEVLVKFLRELESRGDGATLANGVAAARSGKGVQQVRRVR